MAATDRDHEFDFVRLKDFLTIYLILALPLTILIDKIHQVCDIKCH